MAFYGSHTDEQLFALLSHDDEEAFTELYNRYRDKLYSFALDLSRSEVKARDLVHDVFMKIWERRAALTGKEIAAGYLYRMTQNFRIDQLRRLSRETDVLAQWKEGSSASFARPDDTLLYQEMRDKIQEAVERLSHRQKEIYILHREKGLSYAEIARSMNLSVSTVENHFSRALGNIRSYLHRYYADPLFYWLILGILLLY